MDNPSYLLRNNYGIYHFRMVIPRRFRLTLQLREVKRSLKTFHSFRHTVATIWKQLGVHESIPATLLGHSAGGITYTRYGKGYDVKQLATVIEMISYDDLVIPLWRLSQ